MSIENLLLKIGNNDREKGMERLIDRCAFFNEVANEFIKTRHLEEYIKVSDEAINQICINYFYDTLRLKDFHEIDFTNPQKVAAYSSYWVYKCKPLQVIKEIDEKALQKAGSYSKNINANFALHILQAMLLNFDERKLLTGKELNRWNDLIDHIYYFFVYRIVTQHALELILKSLTTSSQFDMIC